jgi:hypothetical protein
MHRSGLAEGHLGGHFAVAIPADAFAMLLPKFRQLSLRHAEMRCAQGFPDLFAAGVNSGIIPPGLMAKQILQPRSLPRFACFFLFHRLTVEDDREKVKLKGSAYASLPSICARSSAG